MPLSPAHLIDTHVHFWSPDILSYPWLADHEALNRRHFPVDFLKALNKCQVQSVVAMQADVIEGQGEEEAKLLIELSKTFPIIAATVAWAPLEQGALCFDYLDRIAKSAEVRGIRRNLQFNCDANLCLLRDFIEGTRYLAEKNLVFELCVDQARLKNTISYSKSCPEVTIVLNHLGKPVPSRRGFDEWRVMISELASNPNVHCKLSGLLTQIASGDAGYAEPERYVLQALEVFGPRRLMFGSDWPISAPSGDYLYWVDELSKILGFMPEEEIDHIFWGNAEKVYRLEKRQS